MSEYTPEKVGELRAKAERMSSAYARMMEIGGGVGALGFKHPEMLDHFHEWTEATTNEHADTVLGLLDALAVISAERDAAVAEMHARELHHFEAEGAMSEALELIQPGQFMTPGEHGYLGTTRDVQAARRVLTAALSHAPEHPADEETE